MFEAIVEDFKTFTIPQFRLGDETLTSAGLVVAFGDHAKNKGEITSIRYIIKASLRDVMYRLPPFIRPVFGHHTDGFLSVQEFQDVPRI